MVLIEKVSKKFEKLQWQGSVLPNQDHVIYPFPAFEIKNIESIASCKLNLNLHAN